MQYLFPAYFTKSVFWSANLSMKLCVRYEQATSAASTIYRIHSLGGDASAIAIAQRLVNWVCKCQATINVNYSCFIMFLDGAVACAVTAAELLLYDWIVIFQCSACSMDLGLETRYTNLFWNLPEWNSYQLNISRIHGWCRKNDESQYLICINLCVTQANEFHTECDINFQSTNKQAIFVLLNFWMRVLLMTRFEISTI